ncbi:MAG: hypothetical protein R8M38_05985 [Mariprofundaceae bacterium]
MSVLRWKEMTLATGETIPEGCVADSERVHLIMPIRKQRFWLETLYSAPGSVVELWNAWLEEERVTIRAGAPEFFLHVGSMLGGHGLMANLTLKENLLLPFLFRADEAELSQVFEEVIEVADFLGLSPILDEQAGVRSHYTHALVSLGRCLLQKPSLLIIQDIYSGISPKRLEHFCHVSLQAFKMMGAGIVYLSAAQHEGSGIAFDRTFCAKPGNIG